MRWAALLLSAVVIAGCGGDDGEQEAAPPAATPSQDTAASKAVEVGIKDFTFAPGTVTVSAGAEVTWANADATNHNVKFDDASQEGIDNIREGEDASVKFTKAGSYGYVCTYHPGMKGKVVVK